MGREFAKFGEIFGSAGVAESETNIADETLVFDTFDGRFCEDAAEGFNREIEEFVERMFENFLPCVEGGFAGDLSEAIPRTGIETVIASIDAVSDGAAEFERDGALVFDGEIRNTACCG